MGVNVRYDLPALWASAGVFGPALEDAETMTAFQDGNKDYGLNCGLSYTGKLVYRPLHKSKTSSLHIGAAVSYRNPKTSSTDGYNAVRYSTRNGTGVNRKKFLDTDAIKYLDHELAYTFELAGHHKGLRYEGAYIARKPFVDEQKWIDSVGENPNFQQAWGWYVQAGYLLFGGSQNYDAGGAKYTRTTNGKEWGDIELCARVEYCNFNISKYVMGGSAYAYALGLNFHVTKNVKFMINYQYNDNDIFANGKGAQDGTDKTAKGPYRTGYDADGNVTYYPGDIVSGSGIDYHMIAARFQVAF
jgi:phosphate-selective porin OprO/OprP